MKSQDWRGGRVREVAGKLNSPPVLVQQRDFFLVFYYGFGAKR